MCAITINFGNQGRSRPEKIDDKRPDGHVDLWLGKAMAATEREEARLQLTPGVIGLELPIKWEPQELRLTKRGSELRLGKGAAEVLEGPGWRCDRDPEAACRLEFLKRPRAVDDDAGAMAARRARDRHVYIGVDTSWGGRPTSAEHPPEFSGARVAQDRVRSTGEHSGHPSSALAETAVADRIDTAMNSMETTCLGAPKPTPLVDADSFELRHRDDTVLSRRDASDRVIRAAIGAFPTHVGG